MEMKLPPSLRVLLKMLDEQGITDHRRYEDRKSVV